MRVPPECHESAATVPRECRQSATRVPPQCRESAATVPRECRESATRVPRECRHSASGIRMYDRQPVFPFPVNRSKDKQQLTLPNLLSCSSSYHHIGESSMFHARDTSNSSHQKRKDTYFQLIQTILNNFLNNSILFNL